MAGPVAFRALGFQRWSQPRGASPRPWPCAVGGWQRWGGRLCASRPTSGLGPAARLPSRPGETVLSRHKATCPGARANVYPQGVAAGLGKVRWLCGQRRAAMAPLARNVLVTGSKQGIGLELVRQLAEGPAPPERIFATCRDPSGPKGQALRKLAAKYPSVRLVQLDVGSLASVRAALQEVETQLSGQGLNLLINNAGINSYATLQSVQPEEMLSVFTTNVVGPLQVTKEFLPLLKKAAVEAGEDGLSCSKAAVINVSTKLASIELCLRGREFPMYPYRASKAALNIVTRCLAEELKEVGVLCMAIHPGWVKTEMGTEKAPLEVESSVRGMLGVLAGLSQTSTGAFLDWEGQRLPW
ncbi:uncharacterized protein LOC142831130 [Pelodiscus sinensis]|uniref:uncharacterized protein LOC142831130 n=1 Tax=Pelodiscus sinensis TaxID=13735 RepID=UPI003F6A575F